MVFTTHAHAQSTQFQEVLRLPIPNAYDIALSPDGSRIAVLRYVDPEQAAVELAIYAVQTGAQQAVLHTFPAQQLCFYFDKPSNCLSWQADFLIANVGNAEVWVWQTDQAFEKRYALSGTAFAYHALTGVLALVEARPPADAGERYADSSSRITLYDLASGEAIAHYDSGKQIGNRFFDQISLLAWSPTGDRLLISDYYYNRIVKRTQTGIEDSGVAFRADSAMQAIGWLDDENVLTVENISFLHFWDADSGQQQREVYLKGIVATFSPDGRWVAALDKRESPLDAPDPEVVENVVKVFVLPKAELVQKLPYELSSTTEARRALQLAFSADGRHLAAIIDESNPTLYVWARRE
jgi:WD40 repeat protein